MDVLSVNAFDLVVGIVLIVSGLLALYRGFVTEALAVAGWIGAAIVTLATFSPLRPLARRFIPSEIAADIATGVVVFVASLVVISLLSHVVAKLVRGKQVNLLDRALGFAFGLLRGYVVLSVIFLLFAQVYPRNDQPDWVRDARATTLLEFGGEILRRLAPGDAFGNLTEARHDPVGPERLYATTSTDSWPRTGYKVADDPQPVAVT